MRYLIKDPWYRSFNYTMFLRNGFKLVRLNVKRFPDGELYVRFLNKIDPDGEYYIILRGFPEQSDAIFFGMLVISKLVENGVEKINLIMPYFPYARQDKEFLSGEVISARYLENIFYKIGVKKILTIDVHNPDAYEGINDGRFVNLSSLPLWANYLSMACQSLTNRKIALIAPDKGRINFVQKIAERIGAEFTYFVKRRDLERGDIVRHEPAEQEIFDSIVKKAGCIAIIDDIIATGGTLANVARIIRSANYRGHIIVGGTHGLFLGNAVDKIFNAGVTKIVTTDTVDNPFVSELLLTAPIFLSFIL